MNALGGILAAALVIIAAIAAPPWWRHRRRRQRLATPLPAPLQALLEQTRSWRRLPASLRPVLAARVHVFLHEQSFVGCAGAVVDANMRVEIASQACLLLLGPRVCFAELRSILVYPEPFIVPQREEEHGVVTEYEQEVSGEAWDTSSVILAWSDVASADERCSPVVHEFAHHLDHADGVLRNRPQVRASFEALAATIERGDQTPLDPDALQNEAEFIAYASEAFFEAPQRLASFDSPLYEELAHYYGVDPTAW